MPSKSESQARLFRMAYAVRKGSIKRSDANKSVLEIADSDMTDKELKDFFKVESLVTYLNEALMSSKTRANKELTEKPFGTLKEGDTVYVYDFEGNKFEDKCKRIILPTDEKWIDPSINSRTWATDIAGANAIYDPVDLIKIYFKKSKLVLTLPKKAFYTECTDNILIISTSESKFKEGLAHYNL